MAWTERIKLKSKIKWAALGGLVLSFTSLLVHLFLAKMSASFVLYSAVTAFTEDLNLFDGPSRKGAGYRRLWGKIKALESLVPYPNPSTTPYLDLRPCRCSKASKCYPCHTRDPKKPSIKRRRVWKRKHYLIFKPKDSSSPNFYMREVLPKLKSEKVIGVILKDGGCLQPVLPSNLVEYQKLRCRVSFHVLRFRVDIMEAAHQMQTSHGKMPKGVINHLMSIFGHLMQLRTLKVSPLSD